MAHVCNLGTQGAEEGGPDIQSQLWLDYQVQGQHGLYETLWVGEVKHKSNTDFTIPDNCTRHILKRVIKYSCTHTHRAPLFIIDKELNNQISGRVCESNAQAHILGQYSAIRRNEGCMFATPSMGLEKHAKGKRPVTKVRLWMSSYTR